MILLFFLVHFFFSKKEIETETIDKIYPSINISPLTMKEQNFLTLRNVFGDLIDYTPTRTSFRYMFRRESQKGTKSFRSIVLDSSDYLQFEDDALKQELEQKKAELRNLKTSFLDMYN